MELDDKRDATKIKELALEIAEVSKDPAVDELSLEIFRIAKRMDARTGTVDPSERPGFHSGKSGTARRRSR